MMLIKEMKMPSCVSFDRYELSEEICPNCNGHGLSVFYTVTNTPVHSCLLMSSKDEALNYPTASLQLGFCWRCGFVTNTKFDPKVHEYSARYEETQGFSECFNTFARSLAEHTIKKYGIYNKTILEIGCGKGQFLATMCRLGDNKGIGIDPAYVPDRNPAEDLHGVEFLQEFYSEKHTDIEADVICCRHTLEHIESTWKFLTMLRRTIGPRQKTLIFFEVPDVMCVLEEGRFWDIYYEHCTYFTAGSLAKLFRAVGFDIDDLYLDYDGQYIIVTAFATGGTSSPYLIEEKDMPQMLKAVENFHDRCIYTINYWQNMIGKDAHPAEKIVLWGSGSKAVAFLNTLEMKTQIDYVVDINPYRQGKYIPGTGQKIVSPEFLKEYQPDKVIAMNPVYHGEIAETIADLNVTTELLTV